MNKGIQVELVGSVVDLDFIASCQLECTVKKAYISAKNGFLQPCRNSASEREMKLFTSKKHLATPQASIHITLKSCLDLL